MLPDVQPIIPTIRPAPFNDRAWLFEPKYDGFRGILYLTCESCTFYSKRGNTMTRFRELVKQVRAESQTTLAVVGTVAYDFSNLRVGPAYGTSS